MLRPLRKHIQQKIGNKYCAFIRLSAIITGVNNQTDERSNKSIPNNQMVLT